MPCYATAAKNFSASWKCLVLTHTASAHSMWDDSWIRCILVTRLSKWKATCAQNLHAHVLWFHLHHMHMADVQALEVVQARLLLSCTFGKLPSGSIFTSWTSPAFKSNALLSKMFLMMRATWSVTNGKKGYESRCRRCRIGLCSYRSDRSVCQRPCRDLFSATQSVVMICKCTLHLRCKSNLHNTL